MSVERRLSGFPKSPVTWEIEDEFAYHRLRAEDPRMHEKLKNSLHIAENGEPYIVLDSRKLPDTEQYVAFMEESMKNGSINGNPHCAFREKVEVNESGVNTYAMCLTPVKALVDLDLHTRRLLKPVCGEDHAFGLMSDVVGDLFMPVDQSGLIAEGEDWDFINPPIFVITEKEETV